MEKTEGVRFGKNPLWFELDNSITLLQKLNYIHNNPLQENWLLADNVADYYFSSASFYNANVCDFGFLVQIQK